jgi:hypothetical protein
MEKLGEDFLAQNKNALSIKTVAVIKKKKKSFYPLNFKFKS